MLTHNLACFITGLERPDFKEIDNIFIYVILNIKIATFSFAAMLLASCSDSNNVDSPTPKDETTIVGSAVKSITDPTVLAARVTNFKKVNNEKSGV